jgi:hypothetical protein
MEESTKRWVSGCAVGCVVAIAIVALALVAGYLGVKKMVRHAQQIETTMDAVTQRYGGISEFHPPPSGAIPAERLEAFLRVRQLTLADRQPLEQALAALSGTGSSGPEGLPHGLGSIRAGFGVLPRAMTYLNRRNEALLDAGMGLGEYLYLYSLAYPCWLGTPVDDGPPFVGSAPAARWETAAAAADPERRREQVRESLNRTLLPMLRHQLEDLLAAAEPDGDASWVGQLRGEIEALERDPLRLPWQDGLPQPTAASLAPFRDRLEASYSRLCNPIELATMH